MEQPESPAQPVAEKCQRCGGEPADEPHECPFASEIYNNCDLCNCCDHCRGECAMDI